MCGERRFVFDQQSLRGRSGAGGSCEAQGHSSCSLMRDGNTDPGPRTVDVRSAEIAGQK